MADKNQILIADAADALVCCRKDEGVLTELFVSEREAPFTGSIFVARVTKVVPAIHAAFVTIGSKPCFLQLEDGISPIMTQQTRSGKITAGDELLVQGIREAVGLKDAAVSAKLQLSGRFCVLQIPESGVRFSKKIKNKSVKADLASIIEPCLPNNFGCLLRTNAKDAVPEQLIKAIETQTSVLRQLLDVAPTRPAGTCLYAAPLEYERLLLDQTAENPVPIVTDDPLIFQKLQTIRSENPDLSSVEIRLYEDPMLSLAKCARLPHLTEELLNKKVWLTSGAFLIIEQTEACVIIDVNTGKADPGKLSSEEFYCRINHEAGKEILRQIRLRHLSGMIIIDFINMKAVESRDNLMKDLAFLASMEKTQTMVVDMTKLGLVELTRRKDKEPLKQQLSAHGITTAWNLS